MSFRPYRELISALRGTIMNIHAKRIKDLQYLLKQNRLEAIVLSRTLEIGFLTGFHLDGLLMLVTKNGAWAFMPKMLLADFNSKINFVKASSPDNMLEAAAAKVKELGLKKAVFEPETESYLRGNFWKKCGFAEHKGLTSSLRTVKEGEEVAILRKSCHIAARSFNLIIGFGPDSALPHHETSERKLRNNEAVLIDYGCVYGNYCSDITRTYFHGKPDAEFKKVYAIVDAAQKAGLARVRAGVKTRDVDAACRNHIADAGYGQYFIHGTGHGVGLEIHEAPTLNTKSEEVLKAGMAVTVEPGIYLHGKFGVRIEDSVLVTKTGCEILTKMAR
jgi:Xaa-Pro aminopeptidase